MVGYNENIAAKLERAPGLDLYCLEEPDLMTSACVARGALREIRPGAYQQSTACVAQAIDWHREIGFEGVMPCREYAVGAAHAVAEALGLRSLGERATRAFTHKAALREACAASGVLQPAHARATSAQDVAAFVRRFGPSVLKPANRQSSVGVVALASPEDAEAAWRYTTAQGEGNRVVNSRELRWDYVIEAKVEGPMFSVESLLLDGRALFENVTRKILDPSIFAVEMGHIVPCPDSPGGQETAALLEAQRLLREAVDAGTGVLHSEWIMTAQGPYLVECAGRAPGIHPRAHFHDHWARVLRLVRAGALRPSRVCPRPARLCGDRAFRRKSRQGADGQGPRRDRVPGRIREGQAQLRGRGHRAPASQQLGQARLRHPARRERRRCTAVRGGGADAGTV